MNTEITLTVCKNCTKIIIGNQRAICIKNGLFYCTSKS